MFHSYWFLPVTIGLIIVGIIYLVVTNQGPVLDEEGGADDPLREWEVQCPKCSRWKTMKPINCFAPNLLNNPDASSLLGTQNRILNEYKCPFCGHTWLERYIE